MKIPFNKPYFTGKETKYIEQAVATGKISGNGMFTQKCQSFFEDRFGFKKALLTTSCTDALEMSALLLDLKIGDEVIIPSYTFVSTANPFLMHGAKVKFADSLPHHPNVDPKELRRLITSKTRAIVIVHYAGMACDMDEIMAIVNEFNLILIEDAAQAIDSYYKNQPLGSFGALSTFSFHETKNIISGEGGMLVINDSELIQKAEIIWEKGTNRAAFHRGETQKYEWHAIGSSFLPSEIIAATLWAQIEAMNEIQQQRKVLWEKYDVGLKKLGIEEKLGLPELTKFGTNNAHMYYLVLNDPDTRNQLLDYLQDKGVLAIFHYLSLHSSPYFIEKYDGPELPNADRYMNCLLRLPLYFELGMDNVQYIINLIDTFFKEKKRI